MATNENKSLSNRHCFVSAKTGGGKSQLLARIPKGAKRLVVWDPDKDHKVRHVTDKRVFLKALQAVMRSGGRIGWAGADDKDTFEWFMQCIWAALDGGTDLYVLVEEAADLDLGQKMPTWTGKVWRRGRKYGAILLVGTQRIQEVPKAFITQAANIYIGQHSANDQHYVKRHTGIDPRMVNSLNPLQFYKISGGEAERITIKYVA